MGGSMADENTIVLKESLLRLGRSRDGLYIYETGSWVVELRARYVRSARNGLSLAHMILNFKILSH